VGGAGGRGGGSGVGRIYVGDEALLADLFAFIWTKKNTALLPVQQFDFL
jgi:hypothetical protein